MKFKGLCSLLLITVLSCNLIACSSNKEENRESIGVAEEIETSVSTNSVTLETSVSSTVEVETLVESSTIYETEKEMETSGVVSIELPNEVDSDLKVAFSNYFNLNFSDKVVNNEKFESFISNFAEATGVPLELVPMPVEEGYLAGFDIEITGFSNAYQFSPMIGSIPFVGYIFEVTDDMDKDVFCSILKDNFNLNWNICTSADEMSMFESDTAILFIMHPTSFSN